MSLVAAGEAHRLEAHDGDLVGVGDGKVDDRPDLVVVVAVDHGVDDEHHVDPRGVQVLDGALLHVEEIADLAMRVRLVGDAVELEVREAEASGLRLLRELRVLRETDAVRGALHAEVAVVARVLHGLKEERRQRRFAA